MNHNLSSFAAAATAIATAATSTVIAVIAK